MDEIDELENDLRSVLTLLNKAKGKVEQTRRLFSDSHTLYKAVARERRREFAEMVVLSNEGLERLAKAAALLEIAIYRVETRLREVTGVAREPRSRELILLELHHLIGKGTAFPTQKELKTVPYLLSDIYATKGGAKALAAELGVVQRKAGGQSKKPRERTQKWTKEKLLKELRKLIAASSDKTVFPSAQELASVKGLASAVHAAGGVRQLAEELGVRSRQSQAWPDDKIEAVLRAMIAGSEDPRYFPSRSERMLLVPGLETQVARRGAAYWAARLGVKMRPHGKQRRHPRWSKSEIRNALQELIRNSSDKTLFPSTEKLLTVPGLIWQVTRRGRGAWARDLGVTLHPQTPRTTLTDAEVRQALEAMIAVSDDPSKFPTVAETDAVPGLTSALTWRGRQGWADEFGVELRAPGGQNRWSNKRILDELERLVRESEDGQSFPSTEQIEAVPGLMKQLWNKGTRWWAWKLQVKIRTRSRSKAPQLTDEQVRSRLRVLIADSEDPSLFPTRRELEAHPLLLKHVKQRGFEAWARDLGVRLHAPGKPTQWTKTTVRAELRRLIAESPHGKFPSRRALETVPGLRAQVEKRGRAVWARELGVPLLPHRKKRRRLTPETNN